jgi:hypothetical protein
MSAEWEGGVKGMPARNRREDATEKYFIEIVSYCPHDQSREFLSEVTAWLCPK